MPIDAHTWGRYDEPNRRGPGKLVTEDLGFHYHFVLPGARLWWQKYRKLAWEANRWLSGVLVPFPKQAWKEACLRFSEQQAEAYYEEWVAVGEEEVKQLVAGGQAIRETFVKDTMLGLRGQLREQREA